MRGCFYEAQEELRPDVLPVTTNDFLLDLNPEPEG